MTGQQRVRATDDNAEEDVVRMRCQLEQQTLQTVTGNQPTRAPQRQCPYCDDRGYKKQECQFLTEDLRTGRVRLGPSNMVETSDGQQLPLNYNRGEMYALLPQPDQGPMSRCKQTR
ncbi:hypothetical protein H4R35_007648 [Dimargaris xerosporica]|nr:hypothetical protein H4R35_007648 [Dimargaris xerosporica]